MEDLQTIRREMIPTKDHIPTEDQKMIWTVRWYAWRGLMPFAIFESVWIGTMREVEAAAMNRSRSAAILGCAIWSGEDTTLWPLMVYDKRLANRPTYPLPVPGLQD